MFILQTGQKVVENFRFIVAQKIRPLTPPLKAAAGSINPS